MLAGEIALQKGQKIYVYVGENGEDLSTPTAHSFNGGGPTHVTNPSYSKGGGATDIRLLEGTWDNAEGLNSRIMVAGGGRRFSSKFHRNWWTCRWTSEP